jgi:hypothetical protein
MLTLPSNECRVVAASALSLLALIHRSAWKKKINSPKFAVANGSSTYRQALENRLCGSPLGSKRGHLVAVVAPMCVKGLRLVTSQLPEKSWAVGPRRWIIRVTFALREFLEVSEGSSDVAPRNAWGMVVL